MWLGIESGKWRENELGEVNCRKLPFSGRTVAETSTGIIKQPSQAESVVNSRPVDISAGRPFFILNSSRRIESSGVRNSRQPDGESRAALRLIGRFDPSVVFFNN